MKKIDLINSFLEDYVMARHSYLSTIRYIFGCILCFILISQSASADVFQQDSGTDGVVSIEAEDYDANVPAGTHTWDLVTPTGYAGSGAMQALPNTNTDAYDAGYTATSPRLDYTVNFVKTGVHYVWVRGQGASGTDDSLHVGLDGATLSSSDRIGYFQTAWTWSKNTLDSAVATINIATAGEHTINVWMREDGMVFDKLVLTVSSAYTPTGTGPAESEHAIGEENPSEDQDSDGLPDSWELQYGDLTTLTGRNDDNDGDGISNWIEYKLGTDPTAVNAKGPGIYYQYDQLGRIKKIERIPRQ